MVSMYALASYPNGVNAIALRVPLWNTNMCIMHRWLHTPDGELLLRGRSACWLAENESFSRIVGSAKQSMTALPLGVPVPPPIDNLAGSGGHLLKECYSPLSWLSSSVRPLLSSPGRRLEELVLSHCRSQEQRRLIANLVRQAKWTWRN